MSTATCRRRTRERWPCRRLALYGNAETDRTKGGHIPEAASRRTVERLEWTKVIEIEAIVVNYKVGDKVVYPHHGAGKVLKKEKKEMIGEVREYLTIKILHNDMTVMVPSDSAGGQACGA